MQRHAQALLEFIDKSPSVFHAIDNAAKMLQKAGFTQLNLAQPFPREEGRYFVVHNDSSLIAWQTGQDPQQGFHIIGSHSDSPGFCIKPSPEIRTKDHFVTLNTEVYGGPIIATWFDRPLSIAGRVMLKSDNPYHPQSKLVFLNRPVAVIQNCAIHMNREINNGYAYNRQKETLPIISLLTEGESDLITVLAQELSVDKTDVLDYDLFLADTQKGCMMGLHNEFISVGKIDNLGMAFASLEALVASTEPRPFTKVVAIFDNEEVGSSTVQGADSPLLRDVLWRITHSMQDISTGLPTDEIFLPALHQSFIISADQAHSFHPNYPEKNDPTNTPLINAGPVIKRSAAKNYTSDAHSIAVFKQLCTQAEVPYQEFVNRSDMRGGSTIGPLTAHHVQIPGVDVGNAVLGMHSIRELGGVNDQHFITRVFTQYFL